MSAPAHWQFVAGTQTVAGSGCLFTHQNSKCPGMPTSIVESQYQRCFGVEIGVLTMAFVVKNFRTCRSSFGRLSVPVVCFSSSGLYIMTNVMPKTTPATKRIGSPIRVNEFMETLTVF